MTTAVVTLQFGEREYFSTSTRALSHYCARHGYELLVAPGELWSDGRDARWSKVGALLEALRTCEVALYLDADALPTDPRRPVTDLRPLLGSADVLIGEDGPGHANTGAMLVRASARDILLDWRSAPNRDPETANKWPVDELGFNRHILPVYRSRIAMPRRTAGGDSDFLGGSFVRHFCNGNEASKAAKLAKLVSSWAL